MFRHPKYYKELRKRNKSDQTISLTLADGCNGSVHPGPGLKLRHGGLTPEASGTKLQAPSFERYKRQASSPKLQASSFKPQASSSRILDPGKSFKHLWSRLSAKIKLFCGCLIWNAIWCGEKRILFPLQTFSSTVKKWPLLLYPNRSGVPDKLRFSSRIHDILGIDFLIFAYNFCSGFKGTFASC